ncbi:Carn acyltransf domain containing protein [Asbolus verrucosus]|uniref:Carn acyltransf domain containing protein n=1 Tax=Asbolus verrucosus TaxID=1661398 RepID=A0A482WCB7_ASBVE|nr:Carn acyltransf domain containing protein [Asbolus verrucosus]
MVFHKSVPLQNQSRAILKLLEKNLVNKDFVEYQYIQLSQIPTSHFQSALPRLPIPELKHTCDRYLAAQRPLLIDEAFRKTEANVNHFRDGVGKQLQQLLKDYDNKNKHTSYISELWFDKYLRARTPLPLNYNPIIVLNRDDKTEYNNQLIRGTNLIVSSLRFYKALKSELLGPEIFHLNPKKSDTEKLRYILSKLPPKLAYIGAYLYKAFPLDMSQYPNLFQSTRIPETDKDRLITISDSKHITVQYKGHFYAFKVLSVSNDILPASQIMEKLHFILNDKVEPNPFPIGILTTLERNKWATIRHELAENNNETQLKLIDTALFNVCLDTDEVEDDPVKITKQFLHADGSNRWFDKSFSLLLSKDGAAAVNFEHAWGDGVAVLRYAQDIFKDSKDKPRVHPDTKYTGEHSSSVHRLDIHLNDYLKSCIEQARSEYNAICNNLDVNYTIFTGIGKDTCKKNQVSPDAVMQLAFQVAYHKLNGTFVSIYESCSTAAFKHGRTEAIRPCTTATKDFTLAINSNTKPSVPQLKKMIKECSDVHNRLIKEAAMGQGFDRHLFALKTMGEKNGIKSNIFDDPEYAHINYDVMSTSTLNSPAIFSGGFGPVVKDGFGMGYAIKDGFLGVLATNYKDSTSGPDFIGALTKSFEEIFSVLQSK